MINRILIAVDCCQNNRSVFDSALSLAQASNATLMLLHVMSETETDYPILPTYHYYSVLNDREYDTYIIKNIEEYKQQGRNFLHNLTKEATAAGVKTEYAQLSGIPGQDICEIADIWSADLIVVGDRGLKGLKEIFVGSVSSYITHHASCSVLIVHTPIDTESVRQPFESNQVIEQLAISES